MVLWEGGATLAKQEMDGRTIEEVQVGRENALFWFPAVVGLALLAWTGTAGEGLAAALLQPEQAAAAEGPLLYATQVALNFGAEQMVAMMGKTVTARPAVIGWEGQRRQLWLGGGQWRWPLRMARPDGLAAVATRLVEYG
jgi:hypothetical protein